MTFANAFMIGADPEFVVLEPPRIINCQGHHAARRSPTNHLWGYDHGGYVVEPHPRPNVSARQVVRNIRRGLNAFAVGFSDYKWRAGAYVRGFGDRVHIGLGGHVHLDFPRPTEAQQRAFENLRQTLLALDILPNEESANRFENTGYGSAHDYRFEHGHMEFRSLCSWLFSQKTSMLCLSAVKLAAVAPTTFTAPKTSYAEFRNWFESFTPQDDDARWIIDRDYFGTSMTARPDRDLKSVWNVNPEKGEEEFNAPLDVPAVRTRNPVQTGLTAAAAMMTQANEAFNQIPGQQQELPQNQFQTILQVGRPPFTL